ncbi:MAG: phytanoyl-CoA dioxygenase family protein [Planctomycetes bacterium]|nr:phytanoyl-CoA dioxygenase family protein [Planctomycetota bacterium]
MNATAIEHIHVTDAQRAQLDDLGYFITDKVIDDGTLMAVREEFIRFWQEEITGARKTSDARWLELTENRPFISQLHLRGRACDAFCRHPAIMDLCRQLVGPDADMTWNQAIIKPPAEKPYPFAWHQDMWYATHGDYARNANPEIFLRNETGITVWAAISRTTVDNGTLWVLPGKHREGLFPHKWDAHNRDWEAQVDTSYRVPAVMEAGQLLVFRKYVPHSSGPNISCETRMAYQIGYAVPGARHVTSDFESPLLRGDEAVASPHWADAL